MNEYLQKLYSWISSKDSNFSSKLSMEDFASKMEMDREYNSKMYKWITSKDPMFATKLPENEFQAKTLKKKDEPIESISQEEDTGYTSQLQQNLGSSEFGQDLSDRVAGIQSYFGRRDMSAQDIESDVNIQAAIADGVISNQDLVDAGYKQPEQVSALAPPNQQRSQYAKNKITALRKKTDEELDFTVSQQRLDSPYAFEQSASDDTFVEDVYNSSLLASMNINPRDFDGFLEERGFKKDFLDKQNRGLFKDSYAAGGDPRLSFEIEKMRMLNLYVTEQLNRDIKWQKIQEQKRTGINPDFEGKQFRPSENNIDTKKLTEYIDTEMPYISQKLKERDAHNRATYQKHINGEMGVGNFLSTLTREGWQGFSDRIGEFSASTYDLIGADNVADAMRLATDVEKVTRPDKLTYGYASGKAIEHNGRKYLVDSNNQVYDTDSKIVVTQFLNPLEYKSILEKAKEFGYDDQTFSPVGTAYQTSNVVGDLVVQLALTRGTGTATSAVGGFTRGLGVLNKTKGVLKAIPVSRSMGSAIIAQATLGASSGYERTFKEARDSGLSDAEARELASYSSTQMAVLYALTAPISPQTKATEAIFGKVRNQTIKEAVEAYKSMGIQGARNVFMKYGKEVVDVGGEGLKELVQENVQQAGEAFVVNRNVNEEAGRDILRDTISLDEFVNTSIISFLAGGLVPGAGKVVDAGRSGVRKMLGFEGIDRIKALDYLSRNERAVMQLLDDQISRGVYTVEAANDLISELNTYKEGVGRVPQDLDPESALEIMGDIAKIRDLENKKEGLDPAFHQDIDDQIQSIRDNIKTKSKKDAIPEQEAGAVPDVEQAGAVQEVEEGVRFTTEEKAEKVNDLLNRPVTLTKLGGSDLDTPIEGEMYVEGQQVVVEDENGNITEIGNVDEISESTLEEMGIEQQVSEVKTDNQGNIQFGEDTLVPDRKGIKRNKRGDISRVVLRSPDGSRTVTLRGANAEEAAYQIMLKEAQSPEQEQKINQLLEQDEEFQNELRQAEAATQGQADQDTEQAAGEQGSEAYVAELKTTKESDPGTYWSVSEVSAEAAAEGTVINTKDGGALVKKDGDIVGVFKKLGSKAKGVAQDLLKKAVEAGGTKLDNFVTGAKGVKLQEAYEKAGFRVVARTPFNRAEAPDGWTEADGTPDVVAMVYDPEGKIDIEEKTFTDPDNGYDQMIAYRDSVLEGQKKSGIDRLKDIFKAPNQKAQVEAAEGALSKLAPDVKIVVHEDEDSYAEATGEKGRKQKSAGEYNAKTKTIHINSRKANARTVAHEAFHAILLNIIGTDAEVQRITKAMIKAVAKSASPELKAALDSFAANYDENIQNEERLAELIGIMASQYKTLDRPSRNIIKRWLDRLAKMFGLKPFTDNDVIDVLNTISRKLQTGEAITKEDVRNIVPSDPININTEEEVKRKQVIGDFEVSYFEDTQEFQELIDKGLVENNYDLATIDGNQVAVHMPDNMFVGNLNYKGNNIFKGQGGVFYTANTGNVWASGNRTAANSLAKLINESIENSKDGKGRMLLVRGTDTKVLSSTEGVKAAMSIVEEMVDQNLIPRKDFRSSLIRVGRKYDIDFSGANSSTAIRQDIESKFMQPDASTFQKRGDFFNDLITDLSNTSDTSKGNVDGIRNFLGTQKRISFSKQGITEAIGNIITERLLQGLPASHAYAIVEVDGPVEAIEDTTHPSYPYVLKTSDGSSPKLKLLEDRSHAVKGGILSLVDGGVPTGPKLGLAQRGMGKAVVAPRKQIPGVDPVDIVRRGREEGVSDQEIRAFLDQEGYTDFEMPPRTTVGDLRKKSESELAAKVKKKSARFISRMIREHILDRQTRVKDLIKGIGSKEAGRAANLLVTKAGGTGYANFRFKKAEKDIYGSLSNDDINTLDEIIYAQRIIAINNNREQAGREKYKGVDGYNEIDAQRDLDNIKSLLGDEKFNDLNSRAKRYFNEFEKNLTRAYEAGLIDEDVYNELKDIEYSPIRTIKYLVPDDYDGAAVDRMANITGMNQDIIKRLSDQNVNSVIMDSRWLLMTNIAMTEGRVFENRMLNAFNDAVENATNEEKEAFGEDILENPMVGRTKTGKPIYKYDKVKVPPGFTTIEFIKDGQKRNIVIRKTYASQLLDIKTQPGLMEKGVVKLTGVNVLRFLATSGNPLFIVGNTAVDFANILFLSDVYGKNKFFGGAKLAFDAASTFTRKVVSDAAAKLNISKKMAFDRMYAEFMEHGGAMDYLSMDGIKAISGIKGKGMLQKGSLGLMRGIGGVLSYLGESSEITFRLAVFEKSKQNQIKQFKKDNGRDPNKEEMEDIMFEAAREARETIDFAQGGNTIKAADKVLPYLNAATQGFRKGFDYALNNPGKFASSAVQAMMMAGSVAALSLFNLFRGMDDDDEKRILEILDSVSEYEKANYHIIFTGEKNEDGEFKYHRIKKLPTISAFTTLSEQMVIKSILKSKGIDYDVDGKAMSKAVDASTPIIPIDEIARVVRGDKSKSGAPMIVDVPMKILNRNPLLSGVLSYAYNYDHFYGSPIFKAPRNYKIDPTAEGIYDDRVNQIYKDLAPHFNMSPKRTKAMIEKIITSETTNPMVGLLYSGYDVVAKEDATVGEEIDKAMDNLKNNVTKKTTRYTNKNTLLYRERDAAEREEIGIETEKYLSEQKVYNQIRKRYVDEKGTMDRDEFVSMIKDNFERYDWERYAKKYQAYIRNMNVDKTILDIVFEDTPEVQAYLIYSKFGDSFEEDELNMIRETMRAARRKFSKKALYIYKTKYAKK